MLDGDPPQIDPSAWICPVMEQAIEFGATELSSYEVPFLVHANWANELLVSTLLECDFWLGSEHRFVYAHRADPEDGFQPLLVFQAASGPENWGTEALELQVLAVGSEHHATILSVELEWIAETWTVSRCARRLIEPGVEAQSCRSK